MTRERAEALATSLIEHRARRLASMLRIHDRAQNDADIPSTISQKSENSYQDSSCRDGKVDTSDVYLKTDSAGSWTEDVGVGSIHVLEASMINCYGLRELHQVFIISR